MKKTLIVGDRGFESYQTFAWFIEITNIDYLIHVMQGINAMKAISQLPMKELDVDVECTLTTTQTKAEKENGYIYINTHKKTDRTYKFRARRWSYGKYHMKLRVVRIKLNTGEYETLVTSLPREEITAEEIKELYHTRWGIEVSYRNLKYHHRFFHRPPMRTAIADFKGFIKKSTSCRQDVIRITKMPTCLAFMMYSLFYQHVIGI